MFPVEHLPEPPYQYGAFRKPTSFVTKAVVEMPELKLMSDLHIISGAIGSRSEVTRLAMCHGVNLLSGCGIRCGLRIQIPYNIEPGIILEIFSGIKYFHEINQLVDIFPYKASISNLTFLYLNMTNQQKHLSLSFATRA